MIVLRADAILASNISKLGNEYNLELSAMVLDRPPTRPSQICGPSAHRWWSSCKTRQWICATDLLFTFRNKSPCSVSHGVTNCSTLIPGVKNSLIKCLRWIDYCTWVAKESFHLSQTISMYQIANLGRGSTHLEDLERMLADWEREIIFHCKSPLYLKNCWNPSCNSFFPATLYTCEMSSCIATWLSLNPFLEDSSIRISWNLVNYPTSWILLIWVSRSTLSRWPTSSWNLACSFRDSS